MTLSALETLDKKRQKQRTAPELNRAPLQRYLHNAGMADISLFRANPDHIRKHKGNRASLQQSIAQRGVIIPLIVHTYTPWEIAQSFAFEIVKGHARYEAALEAGISELPYINLDEDPEFAGKSLEDKRTAAAAITFMLTATTEDYNVIDRAEALKAFKSYLAESSHVATKVTWEDVADYLGMNREHLLRIVSNANLDADVKVTVQTLGLSEGQTRAIKMLPNKTAQTALANEIAEQGLTVKQAQERAKEIRKTLASPQPSLPIPEMPEQKEARIANERRARLAHNISKLNPLISDYALEAADLYNKPGEWPDLAETESEIERAIHGLRALKKALRGK